LTNTNSLRSVTGSWCKKVIGQTLLLIFSIRPTTADLGPPPPQVVHHQHHHHHLPRSMLLQHLRPLSNMDSGLYSTSDSDQEDASSKTQRDKSAEGKSELIMRSVPYITFKHNFNDNFNSQLVPTRTPPFRLCPFLLPATKPRPLPPTASRRDLQKRKQASNGAHSTPLRPPPVTTARRRLQNSSQFPRRPVPTISSFSTCQVRLRAPPRQPRRHLRRRRVDRRARKP
jgi:hypothetical protein